MCTTVFALLVYMDIGQPRYLFSSPFLKQIGAFTNQPNTSIDHLIWNISTQPVRVTDSALK